MAFGVRAAGEFISAGVEMVTASGAFAAFVKGLDPTLRGIIALLIAFLAGGGCLVATNQFVRVPETVAAMQAQMAAIENLHTSRITAVEYRQDEFDRRLERVLCVLEAAVIPGSPDPAAALDGCRPAFFP
jgi:hypothetical protein